MEQNKPKVEAKPATSVILLRETPQLEVFMVVRHQQIKFAGGALVFPGGKMSASDRDPDLRSHCDGQDEIADDDLALRITALREVFEEAGVLLARDRTGKLLAEQQVEPLRAYREDLDSGQLAIKDFLQRHDLRLAVDLLTPYARWITPDIGPKRYDTHFYIAEAPAGQAACHDGTETVDSAWLNPRQAVEEAAQGKWSLMLPTRMNLLRLDRAQTAAAAIAEGRAQEIVPIMPEVIVRESKKYLAIPEGAGYEPTEIPVDMVFVP